MISKEELKMFRVDFAEAVKGLEKKYNLKVELGAITFSANDFSTKLKCSKVTESGDKIVDTKKFELYKKLYGLEADLGDTYVAKGITFTIVDLDPKKSKYPVLTKGSDGKSYKAPIDYVNFAVAKNKVK